jgi:hypothetical protein
MCTSVCIGKGFFPKTCDMYNVVKRKCLNSERETTQILYKNFTTHIASYWITTKTLSNTNGCTYVHLELNDIKSDRIFQAIH